MGDDHSALGDLLALSSVLTGFTPFQLRGTGQAERYLATLDDAVGTQTVTELFAAYRQVRADAGDDEALERGLRRVILSDDKLGPVARNLIKLWYVGIWHELPQTWRDAYGTSAANRTFVVSPASYTEGLLWPAVGANPSGAKPFGYGTWASPPRIDTTSSAQGATS